MAVGLKEKGEEAQVNMLFYSMGDKAAEDRKYAPVKMQLDRNFTNR